MRTTLDIPDPLFRELKARAALDGMKLKDLVAALIEAGLRQPRQGAAQTPRPRSPLPVIRKATTGQPIPAISSVELAQIELEEDLVKHGRSARR
jgi:hypothetical protein